MKENITIRVIHAMDDSDPIDTIDDIEGYASLDMMTGKVSDLQYDDEQKSVPFERPDYSCSYGIMEFNGFSIEFTLEIDDGEIQIPSGERADLLQEVIALSEDGNKKNTNKIR